VSGDTEFRDAWWISTVPVVALYLTVVSMVIL
jgi:ABC-type dipeptide/oligopeptide/nickel transport system permease subunit